MDEFLKDVQKAMDLLRKYKPDPILKITVSTSVYEDMQKIPGVLLPETESIPENYRGIPIEVNSFIEGFVLEYEDRYEINGNKKYIIKKTSLQDMFSIRRAMGYFEEERSKFKTIRTSR